MFSIEEFAQELTNFNITVHPALEEKIYYVNYGLIQINWTKNILAMSVAEKIKEYSSNIRFAFLALPYKSVSKAELHRQGHIIIRYLEMHQFMSDEIINRYDCLFMKV